MHTPGLSCWIFLFLFSPCFYVRSWTAVGHVTLAQAWVWDIPENFYTEGRLLVDKLSGLFSSVDSCLWHAQCAKRYKYDALDTITS